MTRILNEDVVTWARLGSWVMNKNLPANQYYPREVEPIVSVDDANLIVNFLTCDDPEKAAQFKMFWGSAGDDGDGDD